MVGNAAEFKLSITRALTDQLEEALNELTPEPLTLPALNALKSRSGIYHPALYETPNMAMARPARFSYPPATFWYLRRAAQ